MQARADVTAIREAYRMSERQACKLAGWRYRAIAIKLGAHKRTKRCEQIHNHKRVERIYREAGLSLRRKRRKRLSRQRSRVVIEERCRMLRRTDSGGRSTKQEVQLYGAEQPSRS